MKKILIAIMGIFLFVGLKAQTVSLKIDQMEVKNATEMFAGNSQTISLNVGSKRNNVPLINSGDLFLQASFKILDYPGARRSNLKKSAVRIAITYYFVYKGQKSKRMVEHVFMMDDKRTYNEDFKQVFKSGINNTILHLKYTGEILP